MLCLLVLAIASCSLKKEKPVHQPKLPYPDDKTCLFLQARVDSSEYTWFLDIKATASAFCNEELRPPGGVSTADIIILSEALFRARVEVRLPDKILILALERAFKHRGKDSIWRVMTMEEKKSGQ